LTTEESRFDSRKRQEVFLFSKAFRAPASWATIALSPSLMQPELEADHSPPSSAEIKNVWHDVLSLSHVFIMYTGKIDLHLNEQ
jgi:hypothetical protein